MKNHDRGARKQQNFCLNPIVALNKNSAIPELGNVLKPLARSTDNRKSINFLIFEYRNLKELAW